MDSVIDIKDVSVKYGDYNVLNNISFRVGPQELAMIIGPNGSGKSTLIKAILGLTPFEGSIKIFGKNIRQALHHIGYVPQHFDFDRNFPITVEEFLMLSAEAHGLPRIEEVLSEVGMLDARKNMLGKLSGGQLQRVLIARAFLHNPDILILDEPTSGIDVEGVKDFYALIKSLNETHHVAILMVSHELNVVHKFADNIICLNKDLICYGEPKVALTKEVLEKLYGEGMVVREHGHGH